MKAKASKAEQEATVKFQEQGAQDAANLPKSKPLPPSAHEWEEDEFVAPVGEQFAKPWDFAKKGELKCVWYGEVKTVTPKEGKPFDVFVVEDEKRTEWTLIQHSNLIKQFKEIGTNRVMWINKGEKTKLPDGNNYQTYNIRVRQIG